MTKEAGGSDGRRKKGRRSRAKDEEEKGRRKSVEGAPVNRMMNSGNPRAHNKSHDK